MTYMPSPSDQLKTHSSNFSPSNKKGPLSSRNRSSIKKARSRSPAMLTAVISDPTAKRRRRSKIYGVRTFMDPGCPADFAGAFRDNIRQFVRQCADVEEKATAGMPTWCTLLVDENSGALVPLYTVEENVHRSPRPLCDYCRCNGWSHHFVSKRRYHIIIPADDEWDKPLSPNAFHLATHLLHGLLHCNGFGHLLLINGREGGSHFLSGRTLMDLWDRICISLRIREVTVEDTSRKYSLDLRLLFGMTYGNSWFARWGYRFRSGSYGLTELAYTDAIDTLSFLPLHSLFAESNANAGELHRIVGAYGKLRPLITVRDLLRHLIDLKHQTVAATPPPPPPPPKNPLLTPPRPKTKRARSERKKYREFASVAADIGSRWPVRRLITAAQVVVDALAEHGRMMSRQEVRDIARLTIGDTGLIDFVLKSLGNTVIDRYIVRRKPNPCTRVLEFSLDKLPKSATKAPEAVEALNADDDEDNEDTATSITSSPLQIEKDLQRVFKRIVATRPREARTVLDAKHWGKVFDLRDEADDLLRFYIQWMPSAEEIKRLTRALPQSELVVLDTHASIGELKAEAERAMRETYWLTERLRVVEAEGVDEEEWEAVMVAGIQSGATIRVRGEGADMDCELKYEGGEDTWAVGCVCGARDDDGERMVACDACDVWHHTRCIGIEDGEPVPQLFVCAKCGSSILAAAAAEEQGRMGVGMAIEV